MAVSTDSVATAAMCWGRDCAGPCSSTCPQSCFATVRSGPGGFAGSPRADWVAAAVVAAASCRWPAGQRSGSAGWQFAVCTCWPPGCFARFHAQPPRSYWSFAVAGRFNKN